MTDCLETNSYDGIEYIEYIDADLGINPSDDLDYLINLKHIVEIIDNENIDDYINSNIATENKFYFEYSDPDMIKDYKSIVDHPDFCTLHSEINCELSDKYIDYEDDIINEDEIMFECDNEEVNETESVTELIDMGDIDEYELDYDNENSISDFTLELYSTYSSNITNAVEYGQSPDTRQTDVNKEIEWDNFDHHGDMLDLTEGDIAENTVQNNNDEAMPSRYDNTVVFNESNLRVVRWGIFDNLPRDLDNLPDRNSQIDNIDADVNTESLELQKDINISKSDYEFLFKYIQKKETPIGDAVKPVPNTHNSVRLMLKNYKPVSSFAINDLLPLTEQKEQTSDHLNIENDLSYPVSES